MSDERQFDRSVHVRPVADAPVEALLASADELAKRWAIALLRARPLQELAEIRLEALAREAPTLCEALIRALASDGELERILGGGQPVARDRDAFWPSAALSGAEQPRAVVREVESLRGVLWEAALSELRDPSVRLVADLSDRLAFVCSTALTTQLAGGASVSEPDTPRVRADAGERVLYSSPHSSSGRRGAVLIDERGDEPRSSARARGRGDARESEARVSGGASSAPVRARARPVEEPVHPPPPARGRPLPWDTPLQVARPPGRSNETTAPQEAQPMAAGESPVMRITRRPSAPVDERT